MKDEEFSPHMRYLLRVIAAMAEHWHDKRFVKNEGYYGRVMKWVRKQDRVTREKLKVTAEWVDSYDSVEPMEGSNYSPGCLRGGLGEVVGKTFARSELPRW